MLWFCPVCDTWPPLFMSLGGSVSSLILLFLSSFWGGKRDLFARRVQPRSLGGFAVVDFFSKVSALHVQWVRRFIVSPSSWVSFMVFWFSSVVGSPPHTVFRRLVLLL